MPTEFEGSRVLVVDDRPTAADVLSDLLAGEGYDVRTVRNGRDALASFSEERPDLIVTHLARTPVNATELCRRVRAASNVPIMVVSQEGAGRSKIEALDSGADDYVVSPFDTGELLARIRAVLRRTAGEPAEPPGAFDAGDFRIDLLRRRVHVRASEVRLTPKEFDLFTFMAKRPQRVIPHAMLLDAVWGPAARERPEYLRVFMGQLRAKLEERPSEPRYLITEPRVGYRFNPVAD
jgi:two-component system KDP operon response regulator KdpE